MCDFWDHHGAPRIVNPQGYTAVKVGDVWVWSGRILPPWRTTRAVYQFDLTGLDPLCLVCTDGTQIQPNKHSVSDGLSIPPIAERLTGIEHDRWPIAALFHDSGYRDGGLFIKWAHTRDFKFYPMLKDELDVCLSLVARAEGPNPATRAEAAQLYYGVKWFGGAAWRHYRTLDRKRGGVGHRHEARQQTGRIV